MKQIAFRVIALGLISTSIAALADEEFYLRRDRTGDVFGPFKYESGAKVTIGSVTFTLQKDKKPGGSVDNQTGTRGVSPELRRVNLVGISALEKDGVLQVTVFYKDRNDDTMVSWDGGKVTIHSTIYTSDVWGKKGRAVLTDTKTVTRSGQHFYIDLPKGMTQHGLIECKISTGSRSLTTSGTFLVD